MLAVAGAIIWIGSAAAAPLPVTATANSGALLAAVAIERPPVEAADVDQSEPALNFRRQLVDYSRNVAAGTVVIDTDQTYLYFVLGDGKAIRYGIGVGGEGNPLGAPRGPRHQSRRATQSQLRCNDCRVRRAGRHRRAADLQYALVQHLLKPVQCSFFDSAGQSVCPDPTTLISSTSNGTRPPASRSTLAGVAFPSKRSSSSRFCQRR